MSSKDGELLKWFSKSYVNRSLCKIKSQQGRLSHCFPWRYWRRVKQHSSGSQVNFIFFVVHKYFKVTSLRSGLHLVVLLNRCLFFILLTWWGVISVSDDTSSWFSALCMLPPQGCKPRGNTVSPWNCCKTKYFSQRWCYCQMNIEFDIVSLFSLSKCLSFEQFWQLLSPPLLVEVTLKGSAT